MAITVVLVWAKNLNKKSGETKMLKWLVNIQLLALAVLAIQPFLAFLIEPSFVSFRRNYYASVAIAFVIGIFLRKKVTKTKELKWISNIQLLALVMLASIDELAKRFFHHSDVFITAFYLLIGLAFVAGVIIRRQKKLVVTAAARRVVLCLLLFLLCLLFAYYLIADDRDVDILIISHKAEATSGLILWGMHSGSILGAKKLWVKKEKPSPEGL